MSGPRITDAAVEAVREAFRSATDSDEEAISGEGDLFRFILTAALPHIRRAVIEELIGRAEDNALMLRTAMDDLKRRVGVVASSDVTHLHALEATARTLCAELEEGDGE